MTGGRSQRDVRREATRQRIHDTALRLFTEHGYEAVSVGRIATESGVTVPTFYAHFPAGKENVLVGMPSEAELDALIGMTPGDLPVPERLRRAIVPWLAQLDPETVAVVLARWRIVAATPSLRVRVASFERAAADRLSDALQSGPVDPGTAAAHRVAVAALMSAYTQILLRWAESDGARALPEVAEEVLAELRQV